VIAALALLMAACSGGHRASRSASTASPLSTASGSAVSGASGPATLAAYYGQRLLWQSCSGGFQCARLLVPVNYHQPAGSRFSLPVIRLPAADPVKVLPDSPQIVPRMIGLGDGGAEWTIVREHDLFRLETSVEKYSQDCHQ